MPFSARIVAERRARPATKAGSVPGPGAAIDADSFGSCSSSCDVASQLHRAACAARELRTVGRGTVDVISAENPLYEWRCRWLTARAVIDRALMTDPRSDRACDEARRLRRRRRAVSHAVAAVALHLAVRPRATCKRRVVWRDGAAARRQARDHRGAVHLQMGDRCADRAGHARRSRPTRGWSGCSPRRSR